MNFYLLLILFCAGLGGAAAALANEAPAGPPVHNLHCFNADLRIASLDIAADGLRFQNRFLLEGNTELERYYGESLELKTSSDLTINRVLFAIPAADVHCTRSGAGVYKCQGASQAAILDVSGNYTKDNTLVALNGQTQVAARLLSVSTRLTEDLTSDVRANNLQLEARVEIVFLDGHKMILAWSAYFKASPDLSRPSYCTGL